MICPKCKADTARMVHIVAQQDSTSRQDGGYGVGFASGISCLCGYWKDVVDAPCVSMPVAGAAKSPYVAPGKSQAYHVVERFFENITRLREQKTSWYAVAKLMAKKGYRCQEKTLQKYFEIEEQRRLCDGQAKET